MKTSKLQQHDHEWFKQRIGYRVYRTNEESNQESNGEYKYGIVIYDIIMLFLL